MENLLIRCFFELIGTFVLVLLGNGVVAATTLNKTKSYGAGWIVITVAWGLAVMCGVFIAGPISGAHLNPALTIGLAIADNFPWGEVPGYIISQFIGAFLGAITVYLFYKDHYDVTDDPDTKLSTFSTIPAIRNNWRNFFCEAVATWLLVFVVLAFATEGNKAQVGMGSLGAFPVAFLIMAIGMSLGGTTGYALNPARDLAPRLAHAILPIKGKRDSAWDYSWVPVFGPICGAVVAAITFLLEF